MPLQDDTHASASVEEGGRGRWSSQFRSRHSKSLRCTGSKGRGDAVTPSRSWGQAKKCMCLVVEPGICYFYWEAAVRIQLRAELESGCELTHIGWSTLSGDEVWKARRQESWSWQFFFVQVCAKDLEIERVSPCVLHTQIIWSAF